MVEASHNELPADAIASVVPLCILVARVENRPPRVIIIKITAL
jgi:hypothetical protein